MLSQEFSRKLKTIATVRILESSGLSAVLVYIFFFSFPQWIRGAFGFPISWTRVFWVAVGCGCLALHILSEVRLWDADYKVLLEEVEIDALAEENEDEEPDFGFYTGVEEIERLRGLRDKKKNAIELQKKLYGVRVRL